MFLFCAGSLAKFGVRFVDAPPSPTVCFELINDKTGEKRNLHYVKRGDAYNVMYVLFETGSYVISVNVNGKREIAFPTIGLGTS